MNRSTFDRLQDVVACAELAAEYGRGLDAAELSMADHRRDAALYQIALIGEIASKLPADVQALAPEIPWNDIRSMRNHIIHAYWQIDLESVVKVIDVDLEPLKAAAYRLMPLVERDEP